MTAALMVIDFQNALMLDPPTYQVDVILRRIGQLIAKARKVDVPVIYIQHESAGSAWEAGTTTWEFPDEIAPHAGDFVSRKDACDAFLGSRLERHLDERGIDKVYVCGFATEFCIDTNVRRAVGMGLVTVVVKDAHTTRDRPHLTAQQIIEHHNWVWAEFTNPGNPIVLCEADEAQFAPS